MDRDAVRINRLPGPLPVFRLDCSDHAVLYTPGQLAVVDLADADAIERSLRASAPLPPDTTAAEAAAWIAAHAQKTLELHQTQSAQAFAPTCLTVYLSNHCNMACRYCYAADNRGVRNTVHTVIDPDIVASAAKTVAAACIQHSRPFQLVIHGGGEPTIHWDLLQSIVRMTQKCARQHQVAWRGHIATNGMIKQHQALWLGDHFHTIGLSCDGPPDIQNHQRPLANAAPSANRLERTAATLRNTDAQITVRATITRATCAQQSEIVQYIHHQLGIRRMRFEPAYRQGCNDPKIFSEHHAVAFVEHFIAAQDTAAELGAQLHYSGLRIDERHGPYCNVLRQVLHLTPDGQAGACFFSTDNRNPPGSEMVVGCRPRPSAPFALNQDLVEKHRSNACRPPAPCRQCINQYHCTYGCPDRCAARGKPHASVPADDNGFSAGARFRCRINQRLAEKWITRAADQMIAVQNRPSTTPPSKGASTPAAIEPYLKQIPDHLDSTAIRCQYTAVYRSYDIQKRKMPDPLWAQRDYDHTGETAWRRVRPLIAQAPRQAPISIYAHVPFCRGRCDFCDCLAISPKRAHHELETTFARALCIETEQWSHLPGLGKRPVTTVHFGGGTPNAIHPQHLENIVSAIRERFGCGGATEWALESTVRNICRDDLIRLQNLGFTRLHVGVQTLNNQERRTIGRRHRRTEVVERLETAISMGFITSVDIIYGLPGQTLTSLLQTLEHLVRLGIHGISMYRLNHSRRNTRFFKRLSDFNPDALNNYVLFQCADQFLIREGYGKNHFCHYALDPDRNLYANHARRGEDLLALGPTADGVFGAYHYRHTSLGKYNRHTLSDAPAIEGGLLETAEEQCNAPLLNALLSAQIKKEMLDTSGARKLCHNWETAGLVVESRKPQHYTLTANGSWLVDRMLAEVACHKPPDNGKQPIRQTK